MLARFRPLARRLPQILTPQHHAFAEAALTVFRGLLDIIEIDVGKLPREVGYVPHNDRPTADQVSTAWQSAALAARAAERAEAIVEALNDGGGSATGTAGAATY